MFNIYNLERSRAQAGHKVWNDVKDIILSEVNPGNLGALPPSPKKMIDKAYDLGLIKIQEVNDAYWALLIK